MEFSISPASHKSLIGKNLCISWFVWPFCFSRRFVVRKTHHWLSIMQNKRYSEVWNWLFTHYRCEKWELAKAKKCDGQSHKYLPCLKFVCAINRMYKYVGKYRREWVIRPFVVKEGISGRSARQKLSELIWHSQVVFHCIKLIFSSFLLFSQAVFLKATSGLQQLTPKFGSTLESCLQPLPFTLSWLLSRTNYYLFLIILIMMCNK